MKFRDWKTFEALFILTLIAAIFACFSLGSRAEASEIASGDPWARPVEFQVEWSGDVQGRKKTLLWAATGLLAADWLQTRDIAVNPRFEESNRILGPHPSTRRVNAYFATAVIGTWVLADVLPEPWDEKFLLTLTTMQAGVVAENYHAGVRWRF